jgi:hypothetical protein
MLRQPALCRLHELKKKGIQNEKAILPIVDQSVVREIIFDMGFCGGTLRRSEPLHDAICCGADSPFRRQG